MKEAYFKKKLTELSEEAQRINQLITMQKNQLDRIEARIGDFKEVLKRLKDVNMFKQQAIKELKQENSDHIEVISNQLKEKNEKNLKKQVEQRSMILNETKEQLKKDAELFEQYTDMVKDAKISTVFLKEFHHLLLLKLVNKGVLSHREITEIKKRAEKRSLE